MNDASLAEQWQKTGNLMDLLNGEAWIREAEADHASADRHRRLQREFLNRLHSPTVRRQNSTPLSIVLN